ncbi:hypothetical protein ACT4UT_34555, partial [Bacillus sp. B-TM1]
MLYDKNHKKSQEWQKGRSKSRLKIQSAFDNQNTHNKITLRNIEALRNLLNQQLPPDILVYSLKNWTGPQQLDIRNYIFWNATIFALVCMALGFLISIYFFPF